MPLVQSPLAYTGSPPNSQYATVVNATPRAATTTEANAGTLNNVYISPKTAQAAVSVDFASPPVLGFGSTTPRPVHATTLSTAGLTTIGDAQNIAVGTTTGTKVGTATTQKLGFYNATPIVQPAAASDILASLINLGFIASGASPLNLGSAALGSGTFTIADGSNIVIGTTTGTEIGTGATQKIGFYGATPIVQPAAATDIKTALVNLGLLATGASPLDLGSAALGSGTYTIADGSNIVIGTTTGTQIGTGATQKIGFYGATPVVQQLQGAITNSVTSGGSTGVIADITDITTYSNAGAGQAIRDDIYQLALGLQGCIAALRAYGMLA